MHITRSVQLSFAYASDINVNVLYHTLHFQTNILQKIIFPPRVVSDTVDDWNVYPARTRQICNKIHYQRTFVVRVLFHNWSLWLSLKVVK
jgi:hypothetical protein